MKTCYHGNIIGRKGQKLSFLGQDVKLGLIDIKTNQNLHEIYKIVACDTTNGWFDYIKDDYNPKFCGPIKREFNKNLKIIEL